MRAVLMKNFAGKKKVIFTAEDLKKRGTANPASLPSRKKPAVLSLISDVPFPCAASETRRFCHYRLDAEKLSLPTN